MELLSSVGDKASYQNYQLLLEESGYEKPRNSINGACIDEDCLASIRNVSCTIG